MIRAAGSITGAKEIHVIGSQAVLATLTDGPDELFLSREADVFVDQRPDLSDLIDGSIGELSPFDQTFGYYAHGVTEDTATLPAGWRDRLLRFESASTGGTAGLCLELHDLAASKLAAGREKDQRFLAALLKTERLDPEILQTRIACLPLDLEQQNEIHARLKRIRACHGG